MNLCACGCSLPTKATYARGHYWRMPGNCAKRPPQPRGAGAHNWRGGRSYLKTGYTSVLAPGHPNANSVGHVSEHVLIASRALGRGIPRGVIVHHVDENPLNNHPGNLVICQDQAYHMVLHQRQRAVEACGRASWLRCVICKKYDEPGNLYVSPQGRATHRKCGARKARERRAEKRAERVA